MCVCVWVHVRLYKSVYLKWLWMDVSKVETLRAVEPCKRL